ncbi:MAG: EAL domain-containing protein [Betaproteobacteria bacterium]|nr:EAL domain-containing protein [Betaproteobacteria bacterium]
MSLFRQLLLSVSAVFLLVLGGIEVIQVLNARNYLQQQLESHSQDAATALGMSLATVMPSGDQALIETVTGPVFDRGYYESIKVFSPTGEVLVAKELPRRPPEVPAWFARLVVLHAPTTESLISAQWREMGRVIVTSHPNFAYQQLWRTSTDTLWLLLALYAIALGVVGLFLKAILRPLAQIRSTAQAISERNFVTIPEEPSAPELREVVRAINSMSVNIRNAIAEEVARAETFRREAFHDPVSGLDNRRSFEQQLGEMLRPQGEIHSGALYLLELYAFKAFNQRHGFRRGDELLGLTGRALAEVWGERHAVRVRLGGATFALAAENLDFDSARKLAESACADLELALAEQGYAPEVSFGCGVCHFEGRKPTLSELLAGADMALIQAQNTGAIAFEVLHAEEDQRNERGSQYWKRLIAQALEQNRIALFAQPVLPIGGGAPLQQEVMGRLLDERDQPVAAEQYLPMAVRHNMVELLDRKVVERVARYLGERDASDGWYAVNISARSIQNPAFVAWVGDLLRARPAVAPRLVFEITELGVVRDVAAASRFAQLLRASGAGFAVDNFGLHSDAFRCLQLLMPSYIKLSRGFFDDLARNREDQFFISSMVKIARPLQIRVIAQAIEDAALLPLLQSLGIDAYQGYASGKPARIA